MDRWAGKIAVVTGASAGIGLLTSEALVQHGMVVVGLARRKAKMEEGMKNIKGKGEFHAVECDISQENNIIEAFDHIKKKFGSVHILINNAGALCQGATTDLSADQLKKIVDLNLMGLLHCTRQAVNMMKEGKHEGHVVNISSLLGHKVFVVEGIDYNIYPATKFAVRALSETMQNELRNYPIRFTCISPGVVRTEFFEASGANVGYIAPIPGLNAEDVTDAIVYVIGTKPHVLIPELKIQHLDDPYR